MESADVEILSVGVAGGTGSGKTTLTQALLAKCAGMSSVLFHDNYYKRQDELTYAEREKVNYDDLDAFDNDLFVDHLLALRSQRSVESPIYDFADHNRAAETTVVEPAPGMTGTVETWTIDEPSARGIEGEERMRLVRDELAERSITPPQPCSLIRRKRPHCSLRCEER